MAFHSTRVLDQPDGPPPPRASPERPRWDTPICLALIGVCSAVMLLDMTVSGPVLLGTGGAVPPGLAHGALNGPLVASGQWWRIFTTLFVHGGLLHLFFNMSAVLNLGRPVERLVGTLRFAGVSLVTALGSALFALAFSFESHTVGASGMILGWMGVLFPIASPAVRRSLLPSLMLIAVISLMPGISWQGHLGGFLFGLGCGWALRDRGRHFWRAVGALVLLAALAIPFVVARGGIALPAIPGA